MLGIHRAQVALLIFAACGLMVCEPAVAQASADPDVKEINAYKLTEAGLAKYRKAADSIASLDQAGSSTCDDDDGDSDEGAKSIDQMVAKMNSVPAVKAAIQSAGMTTREFVVFSMAIFQAGMSAWALDQPGGKLPAGVSMDNVNFYRSHQAALQGMKQESGSSDCNGE